MKFCWGIYLIDQIQMRMRIWNETHLAKVTHLGCVRESTQHVHPRKPHAEHVVPKSSTISIPIDVPISVHPILLSLALALLAHAHLLLLGKHRSGVRTKLGHTTVR